MTTISSSCCDDDVTTLPTPNGGGSGTNPETTTTTSPKPPKVAAATAPAPEPQVSEAMSLIQLFVLAEVAHNTVSELGELPSILTPPKLNPDVNPFQRSFVGEICRIEEMPHRVRFFPAQIDREHASRRWPVASAFSHANRPRARIKEMARRVRFFPRKSTASVTP
ncbi:hypothetical protein H4582DRAFT_2089726 [Lactarius indigo]|nr:hypothetical protein H4582DRAFT_2089726 [Lactarius indigo]